MASAPLIGTNPVGVPPQPVPKRAIKARRIVPTRLVWFVFRKRRITFGPFRRRRCDAPPLWVPSIAGAHLTWARAAHAGFRRMCGEKDGLAHDSPETCDDRIILASWSRGESPHCSECASGCGLRPRHMRTINPADRRAD